MKAPRWSGGNRAKHKLCVYGLIWCLLVGNSGLYAQDLSPREPAAMGAPGRVVPLARCVRIIVGTPTLWWLVLLPDGSARLGHGSQPDQCTALPADSFSFEAMHGKLAGLQFDGADTACHPRVAFFEKDGSVAHGLGTTAHQAIRDLFQTVQEQMEDPAVRARFAGLRAMHPLGL